MEDKGPVSIPDTRRQQALAAAQAGNRTQAWTLLEAWLRDHPRDDEGWLWLASLTDSPDQALVYLSRALVVNPANERARAGLTWLYQERLRAEAQAQNQIQGYLQRGLRFLDSGQIDAAAWEWEAAVREFPDAAELHANLAVAYYQQGRLAEAVRELETAVRLQPDYLDALSSLGVLREALGDAPGARTAWERVLQLDPNHAEARRRLLQAGWLPAGTEAQAEAFFMLCPYCQGEITSKTPACPHCQRQLFQVCPACQTLTDLGRRFCPACHQIMIPLEEDLPPDQPAPAPASLTGPQAETQASPPAPPAPRRRWRPRLIFLFWPVITFWLLISLAGAGGLAFGLDPTRLPAGLYGLGRAIQAFAAPLPAVLLPHPLNQFAPATLILVGLFVISGTITRLKWAFFANLLLPGLLLLFALIDLVNGYYAPMALVRILMSTGVIALTLLAASEYEEGELAQRIAATPRDADLYYNQGLLYYKRHQLDEAIAAWTEAVALRPSDPLVRNLLGLALAEQGRFTDALNQLEIARQLDPQDANTLNNIRDVQNMMQQQGAGTA